MNRIASSEVFEAEELFEEAGTVILENEDTGGIPVKQLVAAISWISTRLRERNRHR